LLDAALWNLSCISGGRRARTYASIQLSDILDITVQSLCDAAGNVVLVPSFAIEFADEKLLLS
jgi:hypothetical protein